MDKIRSLVRPIVTVLITLTISAMVYQSREVPEWFIAIASSLLSYWFATRGKTPPGA